MKMGTNTIMTK